MKKVSLKDHPDYVEVFTRYITVKGKRVFKKDGGVFHFYAKRR